MSFNEVPKQNLGNYLRRPVEEETCFFSNFASILKEKACMWCSVMVNYITMDVDGRRCLFVG